MGFVRSRDREVERAAALQATVRRRGNPAVWARWSGNSARFVAIALVLALGGGCAGTFRYSPVSSTAGHHVSSVRWSFLWGVVEDRVDPTTRPVSCSDPANQDHFECIQCHNQGFANVRVETNVLFSAVSFLTLGTITPLTVSLDCAAP
jgi:hypothetical protein